MILYELLGTEAHTAYRTLEADNLERQYDFLNSIVNAAIAVNRPMISTAIIKALNVHAVSCLHVNAGEYRPGRVYVGSDEEDDPDAYHPPHHYRVPELMNSFINEVNRNWTTADPFTLAAYCLWRLNNIHPFVNGNGRTARALSYFVVCVKSGGLLRGEPTLPELIRRDRDEYVALLKKTDKEFEKKRQNFLDDQDFLDDLIDFVMRLLQEQLASISPPP